MGLPEAILGQVDMALYFFTNNIGKKYPRDFG
jgi:hypothetical protein